MNHPDKLLPTATNRAIAIEHLTHHIQLASRGENTTMPLTVARYIAERLIDGPAYSVQHTPRRDRVVITFNPPQIGQPLPVAVEGDTTERIAPGVFDDAQTAGVIPADADPWPLPGEEGQRGKPYEGDGSPDDVAATGTDEAERKVQAASGFDPDR